MKSEIELELLKIASGIAQRGYTPENEGNFDKVNKDKMSYTPDNIHSIYKQLLELFKAS